MAAPPDLINDPPSLICRYKDRSQDPISFSLSSCFLLRHQRERERERWRANVYFGLGASKREKGRPLYLARPPSFSLSVVLLFRPSLSLFLDPFYRRFITPTNCAPKLARLKFEIASSNRLESARIRSTMWNTNFRTMVTYIYVNFRVDYWEEIALDSRKRWGKD